jgi:hypothetical protein
MRAVAALLLVFLVSCGGAKREREILLLDSLKTEVGKLQTGLDSLRQDSLKLAEITDGVSRWLVILPRVYQPDTMNVDTALMLEEFKNFNTVAPRFNIQYQRIKSEIPYAVKQLESLLTDLHNKALSNKDAEKFTGVEKAASVRLINAFHDLHKTSVATIEQFNRLSVPVIALLDSLQHSTENMEAIRLKMLKRQTKKHK